MTFWLSILDPPWRALHYPKLLWQRGDRHYQAKKWAEAADWFMAGTHKVFRSNSLATIAKCFRKAALCYIEQREFARASTVIRRCPMNEAKTHYVIFLLAVHQGLWPLSSIMTAPTRVTWWSTEYDSFSRPGGWRFKFPNLYLKTALTEKYYTAISAVREMQNALDFDRDMLLLATQLSHQLEMKAVLLSVLEALLKTLKFGTGGETVVEAMTLIRCIIRLAQGLLSDPTANRSVGLFVCSSKFSLWYLHF
jgi:hypothetical protein